MSNLMRFLRWLFHRHDWDLKTMTGVSRGCRTCPVEEIYCHWTWTTTRVIRENWKPEEVGE